MYLSKSLCAFVSSLLLVMTSIASAHASNAAPLGFELGVATLNDVKTGLSDKAKLSDAGINKFSEGKMFNVAPDRLGIDGLQKVLFIFDSSDVLAAVVLTMNKDPKGTFKILSGKYRPVSNNIDSFMNNGSARLERGDSLIEIEAPHLSFSMDVTYITKRLKSVFNKTTSNDSAAKQQNKANAF